jgi:hypothetical protein
MNGSSVFALTKVKRAVRNAVYLPEIACATAKPKKSVTGLTSEPVRLLATMNVAASPRSKKMVKHALNKSSLI